MNKYVMIPVEQYERYKAFMKSTNENDKSLENKVKMDSREDSLLMSVKKKIDEFPEKVESDKDYKIGIPQEKSFKTKKKSRILPPPGLPQSKVNKKIQNDQQRGEGGRGEGSKPHWLREWQKKF